MITIASSRKEAEIMITTASGRKEAAIVREALAEYLGKLISNPNESNQANV